MPRHPSSGPGWGGPAKGSGNGNQRADYAPGELREGQGAGRGNMSLRGIEKSERILMYRDMMWEIGSDRDQHGGARVAAIKQAWDRDEPVATIVQGGDPERPILTRIERVIIDPRDPANRDGAGVSPAAEAG